MPRGRLPSGAVATTALVAASITVRSPDDSLVTKIRTAGTAAAGAGAAGGAVAVLAGAAVSRLHASDNANGRTASHRCCKVMAPMITQHRSCISKSDASHVQVLFYLSNRYGDKRPCITTRAVLVSLPGSPANPDT